MDLITTLLTGTGSFLLLVAYLEVRHTRLRRARIAEYYKEKS